MLYGTGFIGDHATHALIHKIYQVSTLTLPPAQPGELLPDEVDVSLGDFNQSEDEEILSLMADCIPLIILKLQTRETFFDPQPAQQALGFSGGTLDEAFKVTVKGCGYTIK